MADVGSIRAAGAEVELTAKDATDKGFASAEARMKRFYTTSQQLAAQGDKQGAALWKSMAAAETRTMRQIAGGALGPGAARLPGLRSLGSATSGIGQIAGLAGMNIPGFGVLGQALGGTHRLVQSLTPLFSSVGYAGAAAFGAIAAGAGGLLKALTEISREEEAAKERSRQIVSGSYGNQWTSRTGLTALGGEFEKQRKEAQKQLDEARVKYREETGEGEPGYAGWNKRIETFAEGGWDTTELMAQRQNITNLEGQLRQLEGSINRQVGLPASFSGQYGAYGIEYQGRGGSGLSETNGILRDMLMHLVQIGAGGYR